MTTDEKNLKSCIKLETGASYRKDGIEIENYYGATLVFKVYKEPRLFKYLVTCDSQSEVLLAENEKSALEGFASTNPELAKRGYVFSVMQIDMSEAAEYSIHTDFNGKKFFEAIE